MLEVFDRRRRALDVDAAAGRSGELFVELPEEAEVLAHVGAQDELDDLVPEEGGQLSFKISHPPRSKPLAIIEART